jgi:membrane protein YdbS with pleckstrin-like domain
MAGDPERGPARRSRSARAGVDPIAPASPGSIETVVARMHASGRRLILPAVLVIGVCALTGYLAGSLAGPWENIALPFAAAFVVLVAGVIPYLVWARGVYLITTRRLVITRGFFVRERLEVLHDRGAQVMLRQGPLQSLARSGDVTIALSDTQKVTLADVPDARLVQSALIDLMQHSSGIVQPRSRQPAATRRPFDP